MMMERNETVPLAIFRFESDNFYYSMHWQKGGKERQDIHNGLQVHFFRSLGVCTEGFMEKPFIHT